MADNKSKASRSYNMSKIKASNTKPESIVRHYLFSQGFRYRKNDKRYPGTPDIVLPKYKTVIFVNGCFWHAHEGCKYFAWPKDNAEFWKSKLQTNIARDLKQRQQLEAMGWHVITIWECQLRKKQSEVTLDALREELKKQL